MKKALIIGGGGFIGSNIAKFLLENRDYQVHVVDNFSRSPDGKSRLLEKYSNSKKLKIFNADLTEIENFEKVDQDYDYVFMLAAMVGVAGLKPVYQAVKQVVKQAV